jgi:PST family polysaccharide transporter
MPNDIHAPLRGMRWSAVSQALGLVAQYGSFALLARLLSPGQLGTMATAAMLIGLVAIVNEMGMGAALIQRPSLTRAHLAACFWTNAAMGAALGVLMALGAPALGQFFRDPAVPGVIAALAWTFPLSGLCVLPRATLERSLRFKAIGLVESGAALVNAAIAVALALAGAGVWSLVAGTIVGFTVQVVAFWAIARPSPSLGFHRAAFDDLFGFGLNVLGTRMLSYFNGNVDYMIVGRLMGPAALGVYALAYKLVTLPMFKVSHVALRVAYPAFSRLQDDEAALRRQYLRLVGTLALIAFPLLAALAVLAPVVIRLAFGPQWEAAVLPTRLLCAVGAMKALVCSVGTLFCCKGRADLEFKLNVFEAVKLPVCLLVGVHWGLPGVAAGYLASYAIGGPLFQHLANRQIGLSWRAYAQALRPATWATIALVAVLALWRWVAKDLALPAVGEVAGALPLAAIAYLGALSAVGFDWRALTGRLTGWRQAGAIETPRSRAGASP